MENAADFAEFVIKLKDHDERSWKILDEVLRGSLTNWIIKNGIQEPEEVRSVHADTLSTLVRNIGRYSFESFDKLRNCAMTIALNRIREIRREQKKIDFVNIDDYGEAEYELYLRSIQDYSDETLQSVVNYLFGFCNKTEKEILILYYYQGTPLKEVAEHLSISEANCRILKFRVLARLKTKIEELKKNDGINLYSR
jgi:RNA polymerase sigma factor (sigma-70 family)